MTEGEVVENRTYKTGCPEQGLDEVSQLYYNSNTFGRREEIILPPLIIKQRAEEKSVMKVKTSITLSEEIFRRIDELSEQYGNRSALIEKAVRVFLDEEARRRRDAEDLEIINRHADALNKEAKDVLSYQAEI